ncbi:MAG: MOSC domain-containing protein [Lachnospiraceae bacterium]|nr:MOSC domain-containing protein [Lachnospiraceae bacterium]
MGRIVNICISKEKGTPKSRVREAVIIENFGLEGDAHAGSERQVSLLSLERVRAFEEEYNKSKSPDERLSIAPGAFGENLLVSGIDPVKLPVGTRLKSGEVILEITQIGKKCHDGCTITKLTGKCIMPKDGVFAKVLKGGLVKEGDELVVLNPLTACVITASDRAYNGLYKDESGPLLASILAENNIEVLKQVLLPDDEDGLYKALTELTDSEAPDFIITTGGTGFSPRDHMPEATLRAIEKNAPGISEAVRSHSAQYTKNAMLSRAVSGIRKNTLIINLPGSKKAVEQCMDLIIPILPHAAKMMRGEGEF